MKLKDLEPGATIVLHLPCRVRVEDIVPNEGRSGLEASHLVRYADVVPLAPTGEHPMGWLVEVQS